MIEYYPNNTLKRTGEVSSFKIKMILEGTVISYYKNGVKESISKYKNNLLIDTCIKFYDNEKLEEVGYYNPISKDSLYKVIQIYDIEGTPYLDKEGNGYVKRNISKEKRTEGAYKNGKKDGIWKEYDFKKKEELEEVYVNGIFQKGISKYEDGSTYNYTVKEKLPQFKGGITGFSKFLTNNLVYPSYARENLVQGRVLLSFKIDEKGVLNDFKILKSVSPDLDEEALRVMALSPKWEPGLQNGRPVKVSYSVPIVFALRKATTQTQFRPGLRP